MTKKPELPAPSNLASLFRGLYRRVAQRLDVDASYVSRVARGERRSELIETALIRETYNIIKLLKSNRNASANHATNRRPSKHKGESRFTTAKIRSVKKLKYTASSGEPEA